MKTIKSETKKIRERGGGGGRTKMGKRSRRRAKEVEESPNLLINQFGAETKHKQKIYKTNK